jgi:hypothetical protein
MKTFQWMSQQQWRKPGGPQLVEMGKINVAKKQKSKEKLVSNVADPDPSDPYGMFLALPDPDPDPLVKGMDPDLNPSIAKQN